MAFYPMNFQLTLPGKLQVLGWFKAIFKINVLEWFYYIFCPFHTSSHRIQIRLLNKDDNIHKYQSTCKDKVSFSEFSCRNKEKKEREYIEINHETSK